VVPVFIEDSDDPDEVLTRSAFEPVWQVLKALRAHDRRLADQLDQLRLNLGRQSNGSGPLKLPDRIRVDLPELLLPDFERRFFVRTVKQTTDKPLLTIQQILNWADAHKMNTGNWPNKKSVQVTDTDETWAGINAALITGRRGFPGGSSLAKLLAEYRGVRNQKDLPPLTIQQILAWADAYKMKTGDWPNHKLGHVTDTDETWAVINHALNRGYRGVPGGSSLAKLLIEHRGIRHNQYLPPLTIQQILAWADAYKMKTGDWPNVKSGQVTDTDETWLGINAALYAGVRGFPSGSSLAKLLSEHRGVRNRKALPDLTIVQVLGWIKAYQAENGHSPQKASGQVKGTDETWQGVNRMLRHGGRGLPDGSSLADLKYEHFGEPNHMKRPRLTINQLLTWMDEYKAANGDWPNQNSGQVAGTDENWNAIQCALRQGIRGLPGGSSLAKLLAKYRKPETPVALMSISTPSE
jgi:hypothetical protein